jgi:hypothetical protein
LVRALPWARPRDPRPAQSALGTNAEIRLRRASAEEAIALRHLPTPHAAHAFTATVLIAEVDGSLGAAFSLDAGLIVAARDQPVAELHELLRLRALQLLGVAESRGADPPDPRPSGPAIRRRRFSRTSESDQTTRGDSQR